MFCIKQTIGILPHINEALNILQIHGLHAAALELDFHFLLSFHEIFTKSQTFFLHLIFPSIHRNVALNLNVY